MEEPPAHLDEQYRVAIEEYRFQVDLNWRRSEYFLCSQYWRSGRCGDAAGLREPTAGIGGAHICPRRAPRQSLPSRQQHAARLLQVRSRAQGKAGGSTSAGRARATDDPGDGLQNRAVGPCRDVSQDHARGHSTCRHHRSGNQRSCCFRLRPWATRPSQGRHARVWDGGEVHGGGKSGWECDCRKNDCSSGTDEAAESGAWQIPRFNPQPVNLQRGNEGDHGAAPVGQNRVRQTLSLGQRGTSGRSWIRTRDLVLIRDAL